MSTPHNSRAATFGGLAEGTTQTMAELSNPSPSGGAGPLSGVVVLDLSQILSGPFCAMLLGDLGADVIKIERPTGGDDVRRAGTVTVGGSSPQFHAVNRNKRSLALDLKSPRGRAIFMDLVGRADVVVENFRPGVMDRLGIGYDELKVANPGLIFCSITGFGSGGPYRDRSGFDLIAQGVSGLMSMTGSEDGQLAKIGVPITDLASGMLASSAILAALFARQTTGRGQRVGCSLMQAGIAYTVTESAYYWATGEIARPNGTSHRVLAPYQAVRTSDGHILIGCGNDRSYSRLCRAIGKPEMVSDPRFMDNKSRVANRRELIRLIETAMTRQTTVEWTEVLNAAGCPCGPVNDIAEALADPQSTYSKFTTEVEHPNAGVMRLLSPPFELGDTPAEVRVHAPLLGEHTRQILRDLGIADDQISELVAAGVANDNSERMPNDSEPAA